MKANHAASAPPPAKEPTNLDRKYGRIGISALVAALRYQSQKAKPSQPPQPPHADRNVLPSADEAA